MRVIASLSLLVLTNLALGHGDHEHGGPADGEAMQDYAKRHVCILHTVHSHADVHQTVVDGFGASYVHLPPKLIIAILKCWIQ